MKKKKVLIIAANDMGNSGVPNVYMQIVKCLNKEYEFDLVITRENYYYKNDFLSYGGKIFLIKEREYKNKIKRIFWRIFLEKKYIAKEMNKILMDNTYDIVHCFKESESWLYLKSCKKHKIPVRIIHNNRQAELTSSKLKNHFIRFSISKSIKLSTHNISVSKQSGISFFGDKDFDVICNCIDSNKYHFYQPARKNRPLNILQVGTFLPIKNQLFTLEVIFLLKNKYPDIKCFFIGHVFDQNYYNLFKRRINELEISKNVEVLDGNVDQGTILNNTTISLVPSIAEGLSLTALESQACGIMVLASTGIPKEVDVGNIAFIDLDSKKWANAIDEYYTNNKNQRRIVDMSRFSAESFKEKIKKIYN